MHTCELTVYVGESEQHTVYVENDESHITQVQKIIIDGKTVYEGSGKWIGRRRAFSVEISGSLLTLIIHKDVDDDLTCDIFENGVSLIDNHKIGSEKFELLDLYHLKFIKFIIKRLLKKLPQIIIWYALLFFNYIISSRFKTLNISKIVYLAVIYAVFFLSMTLFEWFSIHHDIKNWDRLLASVTPISLPYKSRFDE